MCTTAELLDILQIAQDTSIHGRGLSLRDAMKRANYSELRPSIKPEDLIPLLRSDDDLLESWQRFSEDKRTSSGWYLLDREIGQVSNPASKQQFESIEKATSEFIIRELDFWAEVAKVG